MSSYFPHKTMWRAFFSAVVAALTLQLLNPFHTGKLVLFQVSFHNNWYWFELLPFVFIGCMGGTSNGRFFTHTDLDLSVFGCVWLGTQFCECLSETCHFQWMVACDPHHLSWKIPNLTPVSHQR